MKQFYKLEPSWVKQLHLKLLELLCLALVLGLALDLVLVPGIAFDIAGNRLGRGRGFYDRMLALSPDAVSCGVGFDGQVVALVPVEPHDVKLHQVWMPTGQVLVGPAPL